MKKEGIKIYKIYYEKSNGNIIERVRNTLPTHTIGETTSMGWKILDIQYGFNNKYYPLREYQLLSRKFYKKNRIKRNIKKFIKNYFIKYAMFILYIPIIILAVNK